MKMKKYMLSVVLIVIVSGCTTIKESVHVHPENNTDSSRTPIASTHTRKEDAQLKKYEEAYRYRNGTIDVSIQHIPQNIRMNRITDPDIYIRQISEYILHTSKNDFEKVKKAHDLVCTLVKYDAESFWKKTVPDQNWKDTLITGRAVCAGYANLFKKICDEINIQCEILSGYGRGVGTSPLEEEIPAKSNHAWNIVTVNNEPYLIDSTWDSGYMDGKVAKQKYTTEWFFVKPEHFIYTHFPKNPSHQLLAKAITVSEFISLPLLKPTYFDLIETAGYQIKKMNHVEGKFVLEYTIRDGYEFSFDIYKENSDENEAQNSFTQFTGDTYKSYFTFPEKGRYLVRIFWKKTGELKGRDCGKFGVISSKGNTTLYPEQYASFGKNIQVISPIEMPLEKGKKYEFKIKIDNKNYAALFYDKNFVHLEKNPDGIFCKEIIIPNSVKYISIGIADTERGRYERILRYSVK